MNNIVEFSIGDDVGNWFRFVEVECLGVAPVSFLLHAQNDRSKHIYIIALCSSIVKKIKTPL